MTFNKVQNQIEFCWSSWPKMNSRFEVNPKFYLVTPNEPNFWVELDFRFQNWVGSSSLFGRIKGNELDFFDFPTFNKGSTNNFCCCFDVFLISLYICIAGGWKSSWLYTLSKNQKPRPVFSCDKPNLSTNYTPKIKK